MKSKTETLRDCDNFILQCPFVGVFWTSWLSFFLLQVTPRLPYKPGLFHCTTWIFFPSRNCFIDFDRGFGKNESPLIFNFLVETLMGHYFIHLDKVKGRSTILPPLYFLFLCTVLDKSFETVPLKLGFIRFHSNLLQGWENQHSCPVAAAEDYIGTNYYQQNTPKIGLVFTTKQGLL